MDGIDPYAGAVSDVYQDMFGEGSYAGKGIYDLDGFELALAGRVPESSLLSHDLFEGLFARAGLASDVEVVEEFPADYTVLALRQHRWARGDWQLLPRIMPWTARRTGAAGARGAIPSIGRWKMLDNLRRTLSAGQQPSGAEPDEYEVVFSEDRAEFARRDGTLTTTMEILVSAEEDAEVRPISIFNAGTQAREIDLTSYAELALAAQAADIAHPAFAKLFVQTEYLAESCAILATRRKRMPAEPEIWAAHLVVAEGGITLETDRARFLGRGHGVRDPAAMAGGAALSGTVGTVLDAVFAPRCQVTVAPGAAVRVDFWTMVGSSRAALLDCIDKHRDPAAFDRVSTLAWTQAQIQLRHLGISPEEADLFQRLAGYLLFASDALRPDSPSIRQGGGAQSGLWGQGISGDLPIPLLRIDDGVDLDLARQVVLAHEYFRLKQLAVDLVILNDHAASYAQDLQVLLETLIRTGSRGGGGGGRGAVFLLRADLVPAPVCALLNAVARVVLTGDRRRLADQLDRAWMAKARGPAAAPADPPSVKPTFNRPARVVRAQVVPQLPALEFFNGHGGFAEDRREYVVVLGPGKTTPAPWINVVANPDFGFQAGRRAAATPGPVTAARTS